ncbi:uncharacterized protein LOC105434894 [Cucumis sativus]|uniref:uncharacterized protein LOC105434894 n=1 Tax=Cucumis sativus TaxID=3659 RepID=UPI0005ECD940|nr:uncharacterized protein LOC105434894 [Cucumis sativus]
MDCVSTISISFFIANLRPRPSPFHFLAFPNHFSLLHPSSSQGCERSPSRQRHKPKKLKYSYVGIPICDGAAIRKSPWNPPELFDIQFLEGRQSWNDSTSTSLDEPLRAT